MLSSLHAVAERPTFDIQAAISKLPPNITRLAAKADLALTGRLSVAQVDGALSKTDMKPIDRLTLKVGLERAGLLGN